MAHIFVDQREAGAVDVPSPAAESGSDTPDQDGLPAPQFTEERNHVSRSEETAKDFAHPLGLLRRGRLPG
jgi:hypothetical protein